MGPKRAKGPSVSVDEGPEEAAPTTAAAHKAEHGQLTPGCAVRAASAQADVLPPGFRAAVVEHTDGRRIILTASYYDHGDELASASVTVDRHARGYDALCRVSWIGLRETCQHLAAAKRRADAAARAKADER